MSAYRGGRCTGDESVADSLPGRSSPSIPSRCPWGADGVEDRVVGGRELVVRDVAADLDVPVEGESRACARWLKDARDGFDLRVVGSDPKADQAPWRHQPIEDVTVITGSVLDSNWRRRRSRPGRSQ